MEDKIKTGLSFKCSQNWEAMEPMDEGKFCTTCQKKVYDLTDKNALYFVHLLQENNNSVCGMFKPEQIVKPQFPVYKNYWRKYIIAALIFIGFESCTQRIDEEKPIKVNVNKDVDSLNNEYVTVGMVMPPLVTESKSMHDFIMEKCEVSSSVNGYLEANFSVTSDGKLTNLFASGQLPERVQEEVVKVMRSVPKSNKLGLAPNCDYSLILTFKNGKIEPFSVQK